MIPSAQLGGVSARVARPAGHFCCPEVTPQKQFPAETLADEIRLGEVCSGQTSRASHAPCTTPPNGKCRHPGGRTSCLRKMVAKRAGDRAKSRASELAQCDRFPATLAGDAIVPTRRRLRSISRPHQAVGLT